MHKEASGEKRFGATQKARDWLVSYPRAIPLALFMAIVAITLFSVLAIETSSRESRKAQAREAALAVASSLQHHVKDATSYLLAGQALLESSSDEDVVAFERFARRINLSEFGGSGIGLASVQFAERSGNRSEIVETFVSEYEGSSDWDRFDLGRIPEFGEAFDLAVTNAQPTASAKIASSPGSSGLPEKMSLVILVAFQNAPSRSASDGQAGPTNYLFVPFDADALLRAAILASSHGNLDASLHEARDGGPELLATTASGLRETEMLDVRVALAGKDYILSVEPRASGVLSALSYGALFFGLILAGLMFLLARMMGRQAAENQTRLAFFEEQFSIRNSLTRELNHRVKNTLANVLSILALTRRRSSSLDEFADSFEGRIRALSATHDLLTQSQWGTTPLRSVLEAELTHVSASYGQMVEMEGPDVNLAPNDALIFGQAVHELATNAAKFGALSDGQGLVKINWRLVKEHLAEIEWQEIGGPPVSPMRENGFGTDLIQKIVAHELKQPVTLDFEPGGVRCILQVAVRQRDDFQIRQPDQAPDAEEA